MKPFLFISVVLIVAASLTFYASADESIVVKSSSLVNGMVSLRGLVAGKDAEFICFPRHTPCPALAPGEYVMVRAEASKAVYNSPVTDCTDVVIYRTLSPAPREKVGVYCWLNSEDPNAPVYVEMLKRREYAAHGFTPIFCFAGQIGVLGTRLSRQPFTVFRPKSDTRCCGELVTHGRTDGHGNVVIEPLAEGEYLL
jgi:hypothetical protein